MKQPIDITDQRFDRLTAQCIHDMRGGVAHWFCMCDCGGTRIASGSRLRRGEITHCGCGNIRQTTHFWEFVNRPPDGCWEWKGAINTDGYGAASIADSKTAPAHRVAWELANGPIPKGLHVLHKCDNPPCCRPEHLFLGTHADNMADKIRKGRQRNGWMPGEMAPRAKLTAAQVREIRRRYEHETASVLGSEFGVSPNTIYRITSGTGWKHLGEVAMRNLLWALWLAIQGCTGTGSPCADEAGCPPNWNCIEGKCESPAPPPRPPVTRQEAVRV